MSRATLSPESKDGNSLIIIHLYVMISKDNEIC